MFAATDWGVFGDWLEERDDTAEPLRRCRALAAFDVAAVDPGATVYSPHYHMFTPEAAGLAVLVLQQWVARRFTWGDWDIAEMTTARRYRLRQALALPFDPAELRIAVASLASWQHERTRTLYFPAYEGSTAVTQATWHACQGPCEEHADAAASYTVTAATHIAEVNARRHGADRLTADEEGQAARRAAMSAARSIAEQLERLLQQTA